VKLDWTGRSLADVDDIKTYIRSGNPSAAARVFSAIKSTADRLRRFPQSGPPGRQPGTREIVVPGTPYLIVYRLRRNTIEILRVLHGRQDWPATDP
jgi:toxin ParE1/3/4